MTLTDRAKAASRVARWEASLSTADALAAFAGRSRPRARRDRPAEVGLRYTPADRAGAGGSVADRTQHCL